MALPAAESSALRRVWALNAVGRSDRDPRSRAAFLVNSQTENKKSNLLGGSKTTENAARAVEGGTG